MTPETVARETSVMHERYRRAEALLGQNAERLVDRPEAVAQFVRGSDRFRLVERLPDGARVHVVDPDAGTVELAPETEREPLGKEWAVSPDERWAARLVEGNLFLLDRDSGDERQVTHDGSPLRPYASPLDWYRMEPEMRGIVLPPVVEWSPDGTRLLMEWIDQSQVAEAHLLRVVEDPRPQLLTWRDALPGDEHVATSQLCVLELESGAVTVVEMEPAPVACISLLHPCRLGWFTPDGERVEAVVHTRDHREMRLLSIDAHTGASRVVAVERGATVQNPAPFLWEDRSPARVLRDGRVLWLSERDGWGHLWVVDGEEWRQVTRGDWMVRELLHVDEERGELLISGSGREPDEGTLERRLYRVPLDGGEPRLLTPEPLDHAMSVSPSGRWVVDCMAGPTDPSVTVLRDARDGSIVRELVRADATKLLETGWRAPQRFTVTAADGETELHGALLLPPDFDESGSYPLMDFVYPGPQLAMVPRRFGTGMLLGLGVDAFVALGVVGMVLDARGTPGRAKAFNDGPLETTHGIADHAAAVRQLAERHSWIDGTRVGMYGCSGGGYMTARTLIEQPQTYTVGISGVGNHDNRRYHAGWGERYIGLMEDDPAAWERQSNVERAAQLRGRLLLLHGEMDANVHPIATRALIAALVDADVDHDVVVIPDGGHGAFMHRYAIRRSWDHVTRHLLGEEPPAYSISPDSAPAERYV